ncbi:hypothetical protein FF38_09447 [Lucilia cuprina]|uniref:Uncharacterized protein n=1 Tax=Lucilia cuprina TaxID=7375 RepID=A0A0L0CB79_LUCCU|nr:hypothetical protein FF38_09447 [Lucilia cuprina]
MKRIEKKNLSYVSIICYMILEESFNGSNVQLLQKIMYCMIILRVKNDLSSSEFIYPSIDLFWLKVVEEILIMISQDDMCVDSIRTIEFVYPKFKAGEEKQTSDQGNLRSAESSYNSAINKDEYARITKHHLKLIVLQTKMKMNPFLQNNLIEDALSLALCQL